MARRKLLIEDFLYPALETRKYGEHLCWLERDEGTFKIYWGHKNASDWKPNDTAVFQDWDKAKGHWKPEEINYYTWSKQRFRAAMYKLRCVQELECEEKHFRIYQLVSVGSRSKKLQRSRAKVAKGRNRSATPIPEMCKYTNEMNMSRRHPGEVYEPSVLNENSTLRISDTAPEPVPVCRRFEQFYGSSPALLHNCPERLLSNICSVGENVPQMKPSVLRENSTSRNTDIAPVPICHRFIEFYNLSPALHDFLHNCPERLLSNICSVAENVPQMKHQEYSKNWAKSQK